MTRKDIDNIILTICPNDEDFEKPIISPKYLKTELEQLALEQEPCEDEYIKVPKKALKYRTTEMVAYNAEWLKSHFDIERDVICGEQEPCEDAISRQAVLEIMDWGWKKGIYPTNKIANLPLVSPKQSFESMTNGEVIKALFPDNPIKEVLEQSLLSEIGENWWNAQYGGDAE